MIKLADFADRIAGDERLDYDKIDLRPLKPSVLSAINALRRPVHLALGCYVHTINTDAQLDEISCLNSLRVCIPNTPCMRAYGVLGNANYYGDASQEVADIVRQNPDLVDLHLSVKANEGRQLHSLHLQTKQDVLKHIGCVVPRLESLTLEGDLRFTDEAWTAWDTRCIWEQLRTLSIIGMLMLDQITIRLQGQLYNLETLKVSAYDDYQSSGHDEFHYDHGPLIRFLAGLKLTRLCLSGFHPAILFHALESSAATLRYLRFQIRENDMSLQLSGGPPYASLLLSHTILKDIRRQCPLLEWIGLNVKWSDLASEEQHQPDSSKDPDLDILTTLAKMPSLRHIRLFLTGGQKFEINGLTRTEPLRQVLSSTAAIATFSHIRTRKRGAAIQSLTINVRLLHHNSLWRIHELGPRMALLEYRQDTISVKEVWDTEAVTMKRREHGGVARGWHPEWGIGDGW